MSTAGEANGQQDPIQLSAAPPPRADNAASGSRHHNEASRVVRNQSVDSFSGYPIPFGGRDQLRTVLSHLATALDDPGIDLDAQLALVLDHFSVAIPSLVGLTLTVTVDDCEFSVGAAVPSATEPGSVGSSLMIPLRGVLGPASTAPRLLLLASVPGALVDLAADCAYLLGVGLTTVEVDCHLTSVVPVALSGSRFFVDDEWACGSTSPVVDRATIGYAIGILFERNPDHTLATARAALIELARLERASVLTTARRIVTDASRR